MKKQSKTVKEMFKLWMGRYEPPALYMNSNNSKDNKETIIIDVDEWKKLKNRKLKFKLKVIQGGKSD